MMEGMKNAFEFMKGIAERGLRNQKRNQGDYEDENGLLICGRCGEPRQKVMSFDDPTEEDPSHTSSLIVTAMCRCEREIEEKMKKADAAEKSMERIRKLRKMSLIDEKFADSNFENFRTNRHNARNLKLCRRYAEKFDEMIEKNQGLIMWGNVGTGKSYAAACIANYLLDRRVPVIMTSFVKLLEVIQKSGGDQESEILARLNHAKLVIFDDLGAERGTDYALEKVYNIVDSRYRKKLPMILTTNLSLDDMQGETDIRYSRIYDRIFEICYPMQFTGPSWRVREASSRFDEMEKLLDEEG